MNREPNPSLCNVLSVRWDKRNIVSAAVVPSPVLNSHFIRGPKPITTHLQISPDQVWSNLHHTSDQSRSSSLPFLIVPTAPRAGSWHLFSSLQLGQLHPLIIQQHKKNHLLSWGHSVLKHSSGLPDSLGSAPSATAWLRKEAAVLI